MLEILTELARTHLKDAVVSTSTVSSVTPGGVGKRYTLYVSSKDGIAEKPATLNENGQIVTPLVKAVPPTYTRPLIAVECPPERWPVTVVYYHLNPQISTGYKYEPKVNPNDANANGKLIDTIQELEKIVKELLKLPETTTIVNNIL